MDRRTFLGKSFLAGLSAPFAAKAIKEAVASPNIPIEPVAEQVAVVIDPPVSDQQFTGPLTIMCCTTATDWRS